MAFTGIDPEPRDTRSPSLFRYSGQMTANSLSEMYQSLTYYPGEPQALKGIYIDVKGAEKVSVAERMGAGKSSEFVAARLRTPDAAGDIIADAISVKEINPQEAQRGLSVLAEQSPAIFSGSISKNLDPMEKNQDADSWRVGKQVQL